MVTFEFQVEMMKYFHFENLCDGGSWGSEALLAWRFRLDCYIDLKIDTHLIHML